MNNPTQNPKDTENTMNIQNPESEPARQRRILKTLKTLEAGTEPAVVARGLGSKADFRRAARIAAGLDSRDHSVKVVLAKGTFAPFKDGFSFYHTSASTGMTVRHPNAYREAGGFVEYHPSTRRILVGRGWTPEVW